MKNARQTEILNIVQNITVETQEQLLAELKARGFSATQATISRDIKVSVTERAPPAQICVCETFLRREWWRWMWHRTSW